jgi:hypothetical protein
MPTVNALPGGVPYGPWQSLYRAAPGAQLPAVDLPGLHSYGMMGAFGAPQVKFMGLGQNAKLTKQQIVIGLLAATAISAGIAAGFSMARESSRPIVNPALFMGGVTLAGGLLTMLAKNGNNNAVAPAEGG